MTGKKLSEHYCGTHMSSNGYVDNDGMWNCWSCYKEDLYRNPPGDIIDKYTSKGYEMRLIVSGTKNVIIDIWKLSKTKIDKRQKVHNEVFNFMSMAMRKWDLLVNDIDNDEFEGKPIFQRDKAKRLDEIFLEEVEQADDYNPDPRDYDDRDR